LEEYRTLTKKERRLAKKKAKSDRKAYRANYKIHKNVWKNIQGDNDKHTRQLKKAEIMRFKGLHWGPDRYDKWNAANRKRREAYRRRRGAKVPAPVEGNIIAV